MKAQLPRLSVMLAKILVKHPRRQDVLRPLAEAFRPMRTELEDHPMKEETILFPLIRQLESSGVDRAFHCGSVRHPVRVMVMEHDSSGEALARAVVFHHHHSNGMPDGAAVKGSVYAGRFQLADQREENRLLFHRMIFEFGSHRAEGFRQRPQHLLAPWMF